MKRDNVLLYMLLVLAMLIASFPPSVYGQQSSLRVAQSQTAVIPGALVFPDGVGAMTTSFEYVFRGTAPSTVSFTVVGQGLSGTQSATLDTYTTVANTVRQVAATSGPYSAWVIYVTWTGGDATTKILVNQIGVLAPTNSITVAGAVNVSNFPSPQSVAGTAAEGAAASGNPVREAGWDGANLHTRLFCSVHGISNNPASGNTQLIALSAGKAVYVTDISYATNFTGAAIKLVYGTGANCGTGTTDLTMTWPTNTWSIDSGDRSNDPWVTPISQAVCVNASAAVTAGGMDITTCQF